MTKWKLKGCPRCNGDVLIESDEYGWFEHCLQCGYRQDMKILAKYQEQGAKGKKQATAAVENIS